MPVVRVSPGGSSAGFAGPGRQPDDGGRKRAEVKGWSQPAARRLLAWLWSVDPDRLEGRTGYAITLTAGTTPDSATEWKAAREVVLRALRENGVTSFQWLTEWTARGRPHMHLAVYGPVNIDRVVLVAWFRACDSRGWPASIRAQHLVPIHGVTGWLQYLSKHAARGVAHYQRQGAPPGWEKTGRLWGYGGDWPRDEPIALDLEPYQYHRYRRLVLAYQAARMRSLGLPKSRHYRATRRYRARDTSAFAGVSGWIPSAVSLTLLTEALNSAPSIDYRKWS